LFRDILELVLLKYPVFYIIISGRDLKGVKKPFRAIHPSAEAEGFLAQNPLKKRGVLSGRRDASKKKGGLLLKVFKTLLQYSLISGGG